MKVLAIDTSTPYLSLALTDNDRLIYEVNLYLKNRHGKLLAPIMEFVHKNVGLVFNDVELICVGIGPGSFTGVRIGVVSAKTLSYLIGVDMVGVSSFDAIAKQGSGNSIVVYHIARGEVFAAIYKDYRRVGDFMDINYNRVVDFDVEEVIGVLPDINITSGGKRLVYAFPKAYYIAVEGYNRYKDGSGDNYINVNPIYVRKTYAEGKK